MYMFMYRICLYFIDNDPTLSIRSTSPNSPSSKLGLSGGGSPLMISHSSSQSSSPTHHTNGHSSSPLPVAGSIHQQHPQVDGRKKTIKMYFDF